jgi:tetratricopeptide (TPR) repeat protein
MNKHNSRAINHLGYCYSYLGDHNQAIQRFEDYRNLDQSANSFDSLGDGYFYAGDLTSAEAMKLAALSKDSKSVPWSYLTLADIYTLRAEYRKVKSIMRKYRILTNSKKETARSMVKQAYIHFLEMNLKPAVSELDQSLSTYNSTDINDYTVAEAHWLKGIVLLRMNRVKACQEELAWLLRIKDRYNLSATNFYIPYKYYVHLKALIAERNGELDVADRCFADLMNLKTQLSYWVTGFHAQFFHTEFIRYLKRNQRFREAIEEIDECLGFNPNYIPCLWEKAGIMTKLNKNSDARAAYEQIARLYGNSPEQNIPRKLLKKRLSDLRKLK